MINVGLYIKKELILDSGVVERGSFDGILDTTKMWVVNQWVNYYCKIIDGTGVGYYFTITSNTEDELHFSPLPFELDSSSVYEIYTLKSNRVELYKDEKISVTSSIQNSNDIGKLFTDYSQSFTIPASNHNNSLFSHWYENDVDNGYDHRKRYIAYIELDTIPFKVGNVQLEKSNKKNGFIESYSITFYGNLTQLKDKFKDVKLRDLTINNGFNYWNFLNHDYNSTEIIDRITNISLQNVMYPLIGSQIKYWYNNGITGEDITLSPPILKWNELFPAVPIAGVWAFIQETFGVTFTGSFFDLDQWTKLYLYLKNSEKLNFLTEAKRINYDTIVNGPFTELDLTTGVITLDYTVPNDYRYVTMNVYINPITSTIPYTVTIYKNNVLYRTYDNLIGYFEPQLDDLYNTDYNGTIQKYYCTISASANFEYRCAIAMQITTYASTLVNYLANLTDNVIINSTIDIKNYVPDITVSDFVTGIIKAFNLMVIPTDTDTFEFIPLEMYYNKGKITDVTKYIDGDSMDIERPKLYKAINFQYEKSNNILNNAYKGFYGKEYGDLIYNALNSNESSNYDIKLPFENVLFEKTVGENFETASIIDKDSKPYTPKPMLIYANGREVVSNDIYITTEASTDTFISYNRFSNEYNSVPTDLTLSHLMTMNFNNEQSPWYNVIAPKGLYYRHYNNYITNLYDIKSRNIKVKGILPPSLLSSNIYGIALNDRLIIRDKRYIINSFTTDLTTGETSFDLLTDYRSLNAVNTIGYRFANMIDVQTDKSNQTINVTVYKNDYDTFDLINPIGFLDYYAYKGNTDDVSLPVIISENTSGVDRVETLGIEYFKDEVLVLTEYITVTQTTI